jgi:hypothetical protein
MARLTKQKVYGRHDAYLTGCLRQSAGMRLDRIKAYNGSEIAKVD